MPIVKFTRRRRSFARGGRSCRLKIAGRRRAAPERLIKLNQRSVGEKRWLLLSLFLRPVIPRCGVSRRAWLDGKTIAPPPPEKGGYRRKGTKPCAHPRSAVIFIPFDWNNSGVDWRTRLCFQRPSFAVRTHARCGSAKFATAKFLAAFSPGSPARRMLLHFHCATPVNARFNYSGEKSPSGERYHRPPRHHSVSPNPLRATVACWNPLSLLTMLGKKLSVGVGICLGIRLTFESLRQLRLATRTTSIGSTGLPGDGPRMHTSGHTQACMWRRARSCTSKMRVKVARAGPGHERANRSDQSRSA